jgi:hypothetical protein
MAQSTGYTSFRDMFDGGGPGRSGETFGGALGGISNSLGFSPIGSEGGYSSFQDMFDGGGRGQSGPQFEGGSLSGMANSAGITPYGSLAPASSMVPVMRGSSMPTPNFGTYGGSSEDNAPMSFTPPQAAMAAADPGPTEDVEEIERRNRLRSMVPEFKEGGRIGPGGVAFRPDGTVDTPLNTQGMGLPPALQALLGTGDMPGPGLSQVQPTPMYSYQMGGQVGPGGMPMPMAGQQPGLAEPGMQGQQLPPEAAQQHIQQFVQQNPEQVQQIQMMVQQGLQTGEITQQQLTLATQMATVVANNPEMYPQFVETMVQQGLFDPGDLPPEFDAGVVYSLMVVGQSLAGQAQEPMMSMKEGGPLPESSSNPDGSIPINAHEGEYVIPAEVVRAKGTDFFDKMIQSYRDKGADQ